jgi:hypothetical protein
MPAARCAIQGRMTVQGRNKTWVLHIVLVLFLLLLAIRTLRAPQFEFGDGREYVLQAQAIVFDHRLAIRPEERAAYWNETNPYGVQLSAAPASAPDPDAEGEGRQFGGRFGSLYLAQDGSFRYIHAWAYSLAVAPLYAALHALAPGAAEYQAFRLANILFLAVPLLLMWRRAPTLLNFAFVVVMLSSPLTPHLQFSHSEIFCLGCILASFALVDSERWRWAGSLFLGLGAAQNVPIAFFMPLHAWLAWHSRVRRVSLQELASFCAPYCVAMLLPLSVISYNLWAFGAWNLIAHLGQADISFLSVRKLSAVLFSPMIGVAWYLPASWLAVAIALRRSALGTVALCCASVLAVAALSSTTANINSAQLSACRYAVWYLGPLYALPFLKKHGSEGQRSAASWTLVFVSLSLVAAIQVWLGTHRLLAGEAFRFFSSQRAQPEVAALYRWTHFHDDVEPLVENITGSELAVPHRFRGIYVWNLGGNSSLWVVSLRAAKGSPSIEVRSTIDLAQDAALTEVFNVRHEDGERYVLRFRDGIVYDRHPYFGGYRLVWVSARVSGMRAPFMIAVR